MIGRQCSRTGCRAEAAVTLTYDYADSLVAVGPLSPMPDPHGYDLCAAHDQRLTVPHGWSVLRYVHPENAVASEGLDPHPGAVRE